MIDLAANLELLNRLQEFCEKLGRAAKGSLIPSWRGWRTPCNPESWSADEWDQYWSRVKISNDAIIGRCKDKNDKTIYLDPSERDDAVALFEEFQHLIEDLLAGSMNSSQLQELCSMADGFVEGVEQKRQRIRQEYQRRRGLKAQPHE